MSPDDDDARCRPPASGPRSSGDPGLRRDLARLAADDPTFDALYPPSIREKSARFWTPVSVAHRAAQLFAMQNVKRVLDIGSGAGKFCLVAACVFPDIAFTGVEQRPHLVAAALQAKAQLGASNVRFFVGDATDVSWFGFDGVYLYNPFAENIYHEYDQLDSTVELSEQRFATDVARVGAALTEARVGTCVVTYNSFGGPIPATYDLVHAERARLDWLHLWVKRRQTASEEVYYMEDFDGAKLIDPASDQQSSIKNP